ncbi:DUF397 domain-containing protein [Embleya scabrispora]|uniref:DUF397 domain-containing protein n=1 Tax=Embleya scabrispora TaxID=159449 RepID=UPI00038039AD|nr:DUF397 domain-containing protein [Embleya scabrispora]MYS86471.1 DUF397 domain-containing protein [Streptomyces sp. SID5474]
MDNSIYAVPLTDVEWVKSSYTNNDNDCVELAEIPGVSAIAIRDSKNTHLPVTRVSQPAWQQFIAAAKAGNFVQA